MPSQRICSAYGQVVCILLLLPALTVCCGGNESISGTETDEIATLADKNAQPVHADMIYIPAGEFGMGCPSAYDPRCGKYYEDVYVADFYIDRFEVTYEQYQACVIAGVCRDNAQQDLGLKMPAQSLSKTDAERYCAWITKRLPTSAEWEKAARGDNGGHDYPWGNTWQPTRANWCDGDECDGTVDGYAFAAPVDAFPQGVSPYGVEQMCGNMLEWTSTPWSPDESDTFVVRGGAYAPANGMGDPEEALLSWVESSDPDFISPEHLGVRCAYSLDE